MRRRRRARQAAAHEILSRSERVGGRASQGLRTQASSQGGQCAWARARACDSRRLSTSLAGPACRPLISASRCPSRGPWQRAFVCCGSPATPPGRASLMQSGWLHNSSPAKSKCAPHIAMPQHTRRPRRGVTRTRRPARGRRRRRRPRLAPPPRARGCATATIARAPGISGKPAPPSRQTPARRRAFWVRASGRLAVGPGQQAQQRRPAAQQQPLRPRPRSAPVPLCHILTSGWWKCFAVKYMSAAVKNARKTAAANAAASPASRSALPLPPPPPGPPPAPPAWALEREVERDASERRQSASACRHARIAAPRKRWSLTRWKVSSLDWGL